jgi:hypothetical protein
MRQRLERRYDQRITRQYRQSLAMRSEHRWPAAPRQRVIETRKIVMD